jgi:heptosyltransferase-2
MQPVRFLILRFSSIGDIVLTTPVVRGLKNQVENSEIHYFTKPQFKEILEANPYVDKVHILSNNISDQVKELKEEPFDYIIDLHHNLRTARIKSNLRIVSFSFDKLNLKKWLLVNFKINQLPDQHIVDRYMETVHVFDVEDDEKGLDYFIPAKDEIPAETLPQPFRGGYIGFVIGAKHYTKKLTEDKIRSIIQKLNYPVVLLGGEEDREQGERIVKDVNNHVFNACGQYNINQSASLVKQAEVIITHDTGLMHVAAAFKKKIISIWGNTIPEFGMYPYFPHEDSVIIENKGLYCRPCSKIGYTKCPKKHFRCILELSNEEIATKARKLL